MTGRISDAQEMISRCNSLRNEGRVEAVLRIEFSSWLRRIFPDPKDTAWVNHYTEGTEAGTRIGAPDGGTSQRFIDNLVRSTVIEYEPDLRKRPRWQHGLDQVQEYVAGTVRSGTPVSIIRGILSDTVDWYVFDSEIADGVNPSYCQPSDIILKNIETLKLTNANEETALQLIEFLRKHLAREQSRPLSADLITSDLGLNSSTHRNCLIPLTELVSTGRDTDSAISLATDLWSKFVDYLGSHVGTFRSEAFIDETYITILARLLCANILEKKALMSDDVELKNILTGYYFESRFRLHNMVEQDYFGWMLNPTYLEKVLPVAHEIQRDLYAYNFSTIVEEDLFGRLMAQLARSTELKLLGQEWTPQWVAKGLAEKCLSLVSNEEKPRIVDMCCGSGSILAEILKAFKAKYSEYSFSDLSAAATGFDIDPLAVLLSKTTWVVTLADDIREASETIIVPIYHADSLFAVTPLTRRLPMPGETQDIVIDLDGQEISLPSDLINPYLSRIFDEIIDWSYDEARQAQVVGNPNAITNERANVLIGSLIDKHGIEMSDDLQHRVIDTVFALATRMAELALANRNGIWAFILRNTYRPGLLAGQFNGLVSNPPWLAMSQFADNPYKEQLSSRASLYGIKPGGSSHLHLELATTHLLHAIDRYLQPNAAIACLVPGTIFNAQNHANFRNAAYLDAARQVPFELKEVWGIAPGTFKVRSAAVVGTKKMSSAEVNRDVPSGVIATSSGIAPTQFTVRRLGSRTAWVLGVAPAALRSSSNEVPPQGADLMPRPAVCIEILSRTGAEWQVQTPQRNDDSYFSVKDAKKLIGANFQGLVAPQFIHRMLQSLNLLPFFLDGNFVHIAIPARRNTSGNWDILDHASLRTAGFIQTARRFQQIDRAMTGDGVVKPLREKIDERHKLSIQIFPPNSYLVVNGAGGGVACAAFLTVDGNEDVVVDQTLYWSVVSNEQEAWYRVGLINSDALTEAIKVFNPSGEFGERHLHTLPNRIIPLFNSSNHDHLEIAELSERLSNLAQPIILADANISNPIKPIASRRRRLREALKQLPEYVALEDVCATVLEIEL